MSSPYKTAVWVSNRTSIDKNITCIPTNIFLSDFRIPFIKLVIDYHRFCFHCRCDVGATWELIEVRVTLSSHRSLLYVVINFSSLSLDVETISSSLLGCHSFRFKGFSPTYLGPTPVDELHVPSGDSR